MKSIIVILLLGISRLLNAQKQLPNRSETGGYCASKLNSLSEVENYDFRYDNVKYDDGNCAIIITYSSRYYGHDYSDFDSVIISNLDANSVVWDITDNKILRVTISGINGRGIIYYMTTDSKEYHLSKRGKVEFFFSIKKASEVTDFQAKFERALKRLIELCGGKKEEEDPFGK